MMNIALKMSIGLLSASCLSSLAQAACTTKPDCATLGYNKTSCAANEEALKCPFDASKLNCVSKTCETIGKKTCGDWCITGNCCSNADCASGKVCDNYVCKEAVCAVGDIYYSDKTCSTNLISSKTPIGVVGYISNGGKNGVVVEKNHSSSKMPWGCYGSDLSCISNMPGSDGGSNPELRADYNGKSNTECIVQNNCSYNGATGAGVYCNSRSVEGVTGWYLPAGGELYDTMIANRTTVNTGLSKISSSQTIPSAGQNYYYWSSSESDNSYAWGWSFYRGDVWYRSLKYGVTNEYVRCVLAF